MGDERDTFLSDPGFTLLPEDDDAFTVEDELDAAEEALLAEPINPVDPETPRAPFGRTWAFDFEAGRFVTRGGSPLEVRGDAAFREWLKATVHTAAGVHPSLPPEVGLARPSDFVGDVDPGEALADFGERLERAVLAHPRVEGLEEDPELAVDPASGTVTISELTVVTDEADAIGVRDLAGVPEV